MAGTRKQLLTALQRAVEDSDVGKVEELSRQLAKQLKQHDRRKLQDVTKALDAAVSDNDAHRVLAILDQLTEELRSNSVENPLAFVAALKEATESFDRKWTTELCEDLVCFLRAAPQPYPLEQATALLELLRRKRYFGQIIKVADVLIQNGQNDANIRRQYAQALLDIGQLTAGLAVLQSLEKDCEKEGNDKELAEAGGLIGRAHKQIYMDAAKTGRPSSRVRQHLKSAVSSYNKVYRNDAGMIWHGINTIALLKRASRDRVGLGKSPMDTNKAARSILNRISRKKKEADLWDFATAAEACLALGNHRRALDWIMKYTDAKGADAFEYASTLRQFEEVWNLDSSEFNHAKILQLLRAALLRQQGGSVRIDDLAMEAATATRLLADKQFEKVLGADRYKTFKWYATGLDRASGVAQIRDKSGTGLGTGFLIQGSRVHSTIGETWVLFTNAHVISDDPAEQQSDPPSLPPDEARVVFEVGKDAGKELRIDSLVFTSPRNQLDCTVVTLSTDVPLDKPFDIAKRLPLVGKNQRVYVIGHPKGGGLSFSIDDNLLLDHELSKVHYRAPTEGGSSGSPVFNQNWDLIALHHAGRMEMKKLNKNPGTYPANEGISFQSILSAVQQELG